MKRLFPIFLMLSVLFSSCEGPEGPKGDDGSDFVGVTFEFTGNFTAANNYQLLFDFESNGYLPYESDVILVYTLWESNSGLDYWRPLPQNVYFDDGSILQYNFDFTADITNNMIRDLAVYLDGTVDLTTVSSEYTQNQIFRVVVVPSDFLSTNIDVNELNAVLKAPNLSLQDLGMQSIK